MNIRRVAAIKMGVGSGTCAVVASVTGLKRIGSNEDGMADTVMLPLMVRPDIARRSLAIGWQVVAGDAAFGIGNRIGKMAFRACRCADANIAAQILAVTKGAGG